MAGSISGPLTPLRGVRREVSNYICTVLYSAVQCCTVILSPKLVVQLVKTFLYQVKLSKVPRRLFPIKIKIFITFNKLKYFNKYWLLTAAQYSGWCSGASLSRPPSALLGSSSTGTPSTSWTPRWSPRWTRWRLLSRRSSSPPWSSATSTRWRLSDLSVKISSFSLRQVRSSFFAELGIFENETLRQEVYRDFILGQFREKQVDIMSVRLEWDDELDMSGHHSSLLGHGEQAAPLARASHGGLLRGGKENTERSLSLLGVPHSHTQYISEKY